VTVRAEAAALNFPPRVIGRSEGGSAARLGPVAHCLSQRAVIETVKPAQDGRGAIIRLYEAHNTRGEVEIVLAPDIVAREGRIWKWPMAIEKHLTPYEIVAFFSEDPCVFLRGRTRPVSPGPDARRWRPVSSSRKCARFSRSITGPFTSDRCSRRPCPSAAVDRLEAFQRRQIDLVHRRAHQHHVRIGQPCETRFWTRSSRKRALTK
jgi:hypothetical protein